MLICEICGAFNTSLWSEITVGIINPFRIDQDTGIYNN